MSNAFKSQMSFLQQTNNTARGQLANSNSNVLNIRVFKNRSTLKVNVIMPIATIPYYEEIRHQNFFLKLHSTSCKYVAVWWNYIYIFGNETKLVILTRIKT